MSATSTDSKKFTGFTGNTAQFTLKGGRYGIAFNANGTGAAALNITGADNSTLIPVQSSITTSPSYATVDLPTGSYVFATSGFTACNVSITNCPI